MKKVSPTTLLIVAGVGVAALALVAALAAASRRGAAPQPQPEQPTAPGPVRPPTPVEPPTPQRVDLKCAFPDNRAGFGFSGPEGANAEQFRRDCRAEGGKPVDMDTQWAGGSSTFDETGRRDVVYTELAKRVTPIYYPSYLASPAIVRDTPSTAVL